jgi:hypothetical protein
MLTDRVRHKTLEAWREASGLDAHSVTVMPVFTDPENGNFHLTPDSPGKTAAEDGGAVGIRGGGEQG